MGLITLTNIQDGTPASGNDLNERFGKIVDELNGKINNENLAQFAVTRDKIAPGAVTSDKIATSRYVDANGWTVNDLGTSKTYSRSITVTNMALNEGERKTASNILPPENRTRDNIVILYAWYGGYSGHAIIGCENTGTNEITVQVAHNWPSPLTMNGTVHLMAVEKL